MKSKVKEKTASFLQAWKDYNYSKMYSLTQKTWQENHRKSKLKNLLIGRIKDFNITDVREVNPTLYDVDIVVRIKGQQKKVTARLICETKAYTPSIEGEFGINPISIIKNLY